MCIGVTPTIVAGSTRPSIRSATAWLISLAAKVSVPVGRCAPCCSTLPQGRITSGFRCSCAAISGCVSSMKWRLGNMTGSLRQLAFGFRDHVGDDDGLAMLFDRTERGIDHSDSDIAVTRIQLVLFARAAALGEHIEFGAEHIACGNLQFLPARVAAFAALDEKRRAFVQFFRRIPCAEVDLIVHQSLRAEHAYGENSRRGP